ncbi:hypothetical protein ACWCZ5_30450 [Streptomyces sp. NPDC001667]
MPNSSYRAPLFKVSGSVLVAAPRTTDAFPPVARERRTGRGPRPFGRLRPPASGA